MEAFARFVRKEAHVLAVTPALTLQRGLASRPRQLRRVAARHTKDTRPWIRKLTAEDAGGAIMTLAADWPLGCCSMSCTADRRWPATSAGLSSGGTSPRCRALASRQAHDGPINRCRVSPDGRLLATAADDGLVRLWDARSQALRASLAIDDKPVLDCVFSPDGALVYACTEDSIGVANTDGTVLGPLISRGRGLAYSQLHAAETAGLVRHESSMTALAISPDAQTIVTTSGWVGTVKLWNATSGVAAPNFGGSKDQDRVARRPDPGLRCQSQRIDTSLLPIAAPSSCGTCTPGGDCGHPSRAT